MKEDSESYADLLPEWTMRGGHFRPNFSTLDVPTPWKNYTGLWKRDELVPYGKASALYRLQFYVCPECDVLLVPSEKEYQFRCIQCPLAFGWSWGGLYEK